MGYTDWHIHTHNSNDCKQIGMTIESLISRTKELGVTDFGIVGAVNTYYKDGNEAINSDGTLLSLGENGVTSNSGAISASFAQTEFEILKLKVTGLTGDNAKAKIFICAYVLAGDEINYLSNGKASVGIAQNSTSVEALLANEEE